MVGEIGGAEEEKAAAYIGEHMTKPVIAYIAGFTAPPGKTMGHAGAIISGSAGTAAGEEGSARGRRASASGRTRPRSPQLVAEAVGALAEPEPSLRALVASGRHLLRARHSRARTCSRPEAFGGLRACRGAEKDAARRAELRAALRLPAAARLGRGAARRRSGPRRRSRPARSRASTSSRARSSERTRPSSSRRPATTARSASCAASARASSRFRSARTGSTWTRSAVAVESTPGPKLIYTIPTFQNPSGRTLVRARTATRLLELATGDRLHDPRGRPVRAPALRRRDAPDALRADAAATASSSSARSRRRSRPGSASAT